MFGKSESVDIRYIIEIKNGMALTASGRWHKIDCDQCETDYEEISADSESDVPESYQVCNVCNKITYSKDLK